MRWSRESRQLEYLSSIDRQLELAAQATERIRDRYLNGAVDYQRVLASILSEQQLQRNPDRSPRRTACKPDQPLPRFGRRLGDDPLTRTGHLDETSLWNLISSNHITDQATRVV